MNRIINRAIIFLEVAAVVVVVYALIALKTPYSIAKLIEMLAGVAK